MGFFCSKPKINDAQKKAAVRATAYNNMIICLRGVISAVRHKKFRNAEGLSKELTRRIKILRRNL